jgi:hypothetical protein
MAVATGITPAQQVAGYEGMLNFPMPMTDFNLNVLGSDDFNRANADPIGGNWSTFLALGSLNSQLNNHLIEPSVAGNGLSFWNAASFPNDQWGEVTIHNVAHSGFSGPTLRTNTASTHTDYWFYWQGGPTIGGGGNILVGKAVAASYTTLLSVGLTANIGDKILAVVSGTNLLVYYNGFPVGAVTDATIASGAVGIWNNGPTVVTDAQASAWRGGGFQTGFGISGNAGVAGASVTYAGTLLAGSVTADGSGDYAITGLIPDTYTLTAAAPGYTFNTLSEVVTTASITGANFTATVVTTSQGPGFGINNGIVQSISPGVH